MCLNSEIRIQKRQKVKLIFLPQLTPIECKCFVYYLKNNYRVYFLTFQSVISVLLHLSCFFYSELSIRSFMRYSFDNIFKSRRKRAEYKSEYKSVFCQFHSIAIFAPVHTLQLPIIFSRVPCPPHAIYSRATESNQQHRYNRKSRCLYIE